MGGSRGAPGREEAVIALASLLLSLWLFLDPFALPHQPATTANLLLLSLLVGAATALSFRWPRAHYAILYAGVWLYLCPTVLPHDRLLVEAHDGLLALLLVLCALPSWQWRRVPRLLWPAHLVTS